MSEKPVGNRKERRAKPSQSVKEQQLATLMMRVYDEGRLIRYEGEPDAEYFKRIRAKAQQILRYQRASKRKAARAARKRNR